MEASKTETKEPKQEVKAVYISKEKKNPWVIYTFVLAVAVIILAILLYKGGVAGTGKVVDKDMAAEKLVNYLNSRTGGGVELVSSTQEGSLYNVMVSYQGDEIPVYITTDGQYFVQGVVPLTDENESVQPPEPTPTEVVKSDKPKVELFVMTECPYGTQAEKGIIPVLELLGDKIDGQISFVHYFMHGDKEEQETYRQVCIREEQPDKYLAYLKCYLEGDGKADSTGYIANGKDPGACIKEAKVSETKLKSCISKSSEAYYKTDSAASQAAGVQGSPTLVINGQIVNSGRSPSAFLQTICSAFNTAPSECEETLDSTNPSAGFGYSAGGSNTAAGCGT